MRFFPALLLLLVCGATASAQDERSVKSPDGQVEFRIFEGEPQPGVLFRLAYQVLYHGKPVINTSFMGLEILMQPLLGENVGLLRATTGTGKGYRSLTTEYMQNGSLGRRINVEIRAYNDGVAFRYVLPRSGPLEELYVENEATEFEFTNNPDAYPTIDGTYRSHVPFSQIRRDAEIALPFVVEEPGLAWVAVTEAHAAQFAPVHLEHMDGNITETRLTEHGDPPLAVTSTTPYTCPWRIVLIGASPSQLLASRLVSSLEP